MATNYPTALDTTGTTLPDNKADLTPTAADHASHHNNIADAIIAIETELGTTPSGSYSTVAAAILNKIDKSPSANQVIQPTADAVALITKAGSGSYTSNLFEARLFTDLIVAFIDKNGGFSAQSLSINGAALASTHLSDSAALARLASPAFTGTPTAPTPVGGDNSTKIATTAFVTTAIGNSVSVPIGAVMDWPWASGGIPSWSLLPYGQAISRTTYSALAALASAAGYPHGSGDGSTTFNLPDYRGRVGAGKDDMGGVTANRITAAVSGVNGATLGATGGSEGVTLTTAQIPAHNHSISITDPGHTHQITIAVQNFSGGSDVDLRNDTSTSFGQTYTSTSSTTGISASAANAGGGGSHLNLTPTIIVNKIIRAL